MTRLLAALVAALLAASVGTPPAHAARIPRADAAAPRDTVDVAAMRRLSGDVHLPAAPLDSARLARYLDALGALHADWRARPAARDSFVGVDRDVELRFWDAESAAEGAAIVAQRRRRYAAVPGAAARGGARAPLRRVRHAAPQGAVRAHPPGLRRRRGGRARARGAVRR
jgi:hypothetical protein